MSQSQTTSGEPKKRPPTLTDRVKNLEKLLKGDDQHWSFTEMEGILSKTDLTPEMKEQELLDLGARVKIIEELIDHLGKSESHTGSQTLGTRLDIIEGNLEILHSSHLGHTNYTAAEFKQMHGFTPETTHGPEPKDNDIGRLFKTATALRDLILKIREDEFEDGYFAIGSVMEILADAAGMEVVIR